jgi:Ser/Thr protein kinase RdoA (MazF antagonist)
MNVSESRFLEEVFGHFFQSSSDCLIEPVTHGNINTTYRVQSTEGKFVLQRISREVFPDPLRVIDNFFHIAGHIRKKCAGMPYEWHCARPVYTVTGERYYKDERGDFWRVQTYLNHHPPSLPLSTESARELGRALAVFHQIISDIDPEILQDPLPGFHILPGYFKQYDAVSVTRQPVDRGELWCAGIIERYRDKADFFERAKKNGVLSLQPVHGDPKFDNFIFDCRGRGTGLIDLDTVSVGLVHSDLGDCLRSCCNSGGENCSGVLDVRFDFDSCREILAGYFELQPRSLTLEQRTYIYDAVLLLTFELGLRFFTDHLCGDTYFKVKKKGENLQRAVIQFRLMEEIEKHEQQIRREAER